LHGDHLPLERRAERGLVLGEHGPRDDRSGKAREYDGFHGSLLRKGATNSRTGRVRRLFQRGGRCRQRRPVARRSLAAEPTIAHFSRMESGTELTAVQSLFGDRYAIDGEIGRGGMATVYRAE